MARALIASFDAESVVAYQAFPEALGAEIVARRGLGGGWRFDRHTRLQTSWRFVADRYAFGDRLHRSRILAIHVSRAGFDALVTAALTAEWDPALYKTSGAWRLATRFAPVLVEWIDETPRFVVHGPLVRQLATEWVVDLRDVSAEFRALRDGEARAPQEADYPVPPDVAARIGLHL
jgi:hypothetical protein